jgi:hypothetical protein
MDEFRHSEPVEEIPAVNEWEIDLTREEYIRYYTLFSKLSGPLRMQNVQLIVSLVFCVVLIGFCVIDFMQTGVVDWLFAGIGGVLLLASFFLWWYAPHHVRRAAAKAYDETLAGGYCYRGTLRVRDDRVEKENEQGIHTVKLGSTTLFIENPDMMVFLTANRRSIVIPARYLTAEAASAVREAAEKLPYRNRRYLGRVEPKGETPAHVCLPEDTVLWEQSVRYEPDELADLIRYNATQNFLKRLPFHSVMSVLFGVGLGWDGSTNMLPCIGWFIGFFALTTVFNLVMPRRRAQFIAAQADIAARTVDIKLTERGVWMTDPNKGFAVIPWTAIEHVIDRDTFVEITRGVQSIRIPKRQIADFSAFDALIRTYWKKTKSR